MSEENRYADQPATVTQFATLDIGGLRFQISFRLGSPRPNVLIEGATLRVEGPVDGEWTELLRFDDFVDDPHYHVPATSRPIPFDRSNGEPLAWFISQITDDLPENVQKAGFESVLSSIDLDQIKANAQQVAEAMIACTPDGYVRIPDIGLQREQVSA
jgi:hypothetical protein